MFVYFRFYLFLENNKSDAHDILSTSDECSCAKRKLHSTQSRKGRQLTSHLLVISCVQKQLILPWHHRPQHHRNTVWLFSLSPEKHTSNYVHSTSGLNRNISYLFGFMIFMAVVTEDNFAGSSHNSRKLDAD